MLCDWKVGDKIRCIEDRLAEEHLKKGDIYKVVKITHSPTSVNMDYVYVGTKGNDGWPFRMFELVSKESKLAQCPQCGTYYQKKYMHCCKVKPLAEGTKYDEGKLRYDLLDAYALDELVKVLTYGTKKYADRNWEKGMKWSRIFGACMRHLWTFWRGEMFSKDDKLPHLAQAMWCCMALLHYSKYKREFDDRPDHKFRVILYGKKLHHEGDK